MNENELIKEWVRFAHNDLVVAKRVIDDFYPKQTEISCYHCQQAAEKILKGYLTSRRLDPPRTHNLIQLCQMCMDIDSSFESLLAACSDLTPYAAGTRYPDALEADETMAKQAVDRAEKIYHFCLERLPEPSG